MPQKTAAKKSETLEIRISHDLKCKLADLSAERGSSMSAVVRGVIDRELSGVKHVAVGDQTMPFRYLRTYSPKLIYMLPVLFLAAFYWGATQAPVSATPEARFFFAELDMNGDGVVVEEELHQFLMYEENMVIAGECDPGAEPCTVEDIAAVEVQRADTNRDGHVEYDEFESLYLADRSDEFKTYDRDGNNRLSEDELLLGEAQSLANDPTRPEPLSAECLTILQADAVAGIAGACFSDRDRRVFMAELDANADGGISLIEFLQH